MSKQNYKKIYAMNKEREKQILKICPDISNNSGIYVFYRVDELGFKYCYCGQAKHIRERCASHLAEYDHIGLSLKKRGFYSEDNPYGWKLFFYTCLEKDLDENERYEIKNLADKGYQLYNVSSGGQGKGRTQIGEYKPQKTYRQGIETGRKSLAKELKHIIDTHLTIMLKQGKEGNKVSQKALEKFWSLLETEESESEKD